MSHDTSAETIEAINQDNISATEWIHLTEGKQFSRLLYTNPVCFLCTHDNSQSNVMVISWLTATNNEGNFMMSLNKHRHTASYMSSANRDFVLCVPTRGMEDLVLAVGGTSGRNGNKFPSGERMAPEAQVISKRQLKKQRQAHGIAGLQQVAFAESDNNSLFAIQGTIAHLHCRTERVMDHTIDEEHLLILAKIVDAYCRVDYWDAGKNLFRPRTASAPYLTFFGSQTFGCVVSDEMPKLSPPDKCGES